MHVFCKIKSTQVPRAKLIQLVLLLLFLSHKNLLRLEIKEWWKGWYKPVVTARKLA